MKKTTCTFSYGGRRAHFRMAGVAPPYENVHVGFFHSYLKETKKFNNKFLNEM